ncbi:hypothetical protein [Peribacillus frigoritolerans]|nr:hypothetical protein [Peribacillus frigoritolerans]
MTNNYFTKPAKSLGLSNDVVLIERDELIDMMMEEKQEARIM